METGEAHFWSRSRNRLWRKGETSGNRLLVEDLLTDCDQDVLWLRSSLGRGGLPHGPAELLLPAYNAKTGIKANLNLL